MQRANAVHIVDFQHGEIFAVAVQNGVHFVQNECVGAAAETCQFYKLQIAVWPARSKVCRLEQTVGVRPLTERVQLPENIAAVVRSDMLGNYIDAHVGDGLRYFVFDQRIGVVGATGQQNDGASCGSGARQNFVIAPRELR